ncbi:ribosome maturation factor RimM [Paenibacillus sp. GCM10012307]|uniref:Ribosome maturation factor RimM n=1 Tax=Paenibacillus roseus TaxID=2798579 RepID=A0A934JAB6_9BACL|nr:ribosome maturation factor RimM [Paenibacillus roseus]MBJ6363352.1 ribosome maturation factor RimM [Paenibacillus roseus]
MQWLNVGKLVNTHGLRGEVKILSQTDFPDVRFALGSKLALFSPEGNQRLDVLINSTREHKGMFFLKFKDYNDINQVEKYKGWSVKVPEEQQVELEEGEYYYYEIVGCKVFTEEGEELGTIAEILRPGANDVWVVERGSGKPVLLPFIDDVVLQVDTKQKLVTVRLMEGLI